MDLIRSSLSNVFVKVGCTGVVLVIATVWGGTPGKIPDDTLAALQTGEVFEILSLNPRWAQTNTDFHGYRVLGKTTVTNAETRLELIAALKKAAEENKGVVARCFNPRHGIRVSFNGQNVDLAICFQCSRIYVYNAGKDQGPILTTHSPQPLFDKVLTDAGLPLAPKK